MTLDAVWPYLVVLIVGALPNGIFRAAAVFLARGVQAESQLLEWVRIVAVALLAAVVSKIVVSPPAALATVPLWAPIAAIGTGVAAYRVVPSLFGAIVVGEALLVLLAWLAG